MARNPMGRIRMEDRKYEIEEAARTLTKAEEVRTNKPLFGLAKKELQRQQDNVTRALGKVREKDVR